MAKLFGRQYHIDIGDGEKIIDSREQIHPLQIEFSIETSFGDAMSLMELSIYNLNKESIGKIRQKQRIVLQAGYPDVFGPIFEGRIINFHSPQIGTERKTTLYCWSGVAELKDKQCSVSFAAGSRYFDIVEYVATDIFGKSPEYIGFDDAYKQALGIATDGYNALNPHKIILDNLARTLEFQWLIENERCLLMERGRNRAGQVFNINAKSGLVGGVSLTYLGADFEMKLNPNIGIGDRVKVDAVQSTINFSAIYNVSLPKEKATIGDGRYVVKALRRQGSFYGENSWNSAFTCWREGETGLERPEAQR